MPPSLTFVSDQGRYTASVTRVTVESPKAEVIDMTGVNDGANFQVLVPSGCKRGGEVTVDFINSTDSTGLSPGIEGALGNLTINASNASVSKQVILESCSQLSAVGDVMRGSARFVVTDWYG